MKMSVCLIMGNYLQDYRLAIGLFNRVKICYSGCIVQIRLMSLFLFLLCLTLFLLLLCGDVESNPGPVKLTKLSLCHVNIRGLNKLKLNAIKTTLSRVYDIITISETFLSPNSSVNLDMEDYHPIVRRDRDTFGGGVAVYIREDIVYKRKLNLESKDLESIWIEVKTKEGPLLICTVYRPPNSFEFWEHLESNTEYVKAESSTQNLVIIGDMNADLLTANGKKLLDICNIHNLHHHIKEPTRITPNSNSCIDQIISGVPGDTFSSTSCKSFIFGIKMKLMTCRLILVRVARWQMTQNKMAAIFQNGGREK